MVPSTSRDTLRRLVAAGMDVLRLNLAHATTEQASGVVAEYRAACAERGRLPCVLCELRGSELRSSYLMDREGGAPVRQVELRAGQRVVLFGTAVTSAPEFVGWSSGDDGARIGVQYEALGEITPVGTVVRLLELACARSGADTQQENQGRGYLVGWTKNHLDGSCAAVRGRVQGAGCRGLEGSP